MAPEVAIGEQYNEKCDSYSFALLLWEILELERPFSSFKTLSDMELVWNAPCTRPVLNKCWSEEIQVLLKQAWTHDVRKRLSMKQIMEKLHKESLQAAGGDESRLEQQRRRSTNVFNPRQKGRRASSASISVPSRRSSVSRRSHRRSSQSGNLSAAITTSPRSNLSDERTSSKDTSQTQPSGVELAAHLFNELTSLDESIHHHAPPSQHCQVQHHKSVPLDPMKEDTSCSETVAEATESSVSGESPGPNRSDERPPQLIKKEQQLLERLQDIEHILVSDHELTERQNQRSESFAPRFVPSYKAFLDSKS